MPSVAGMGRGRLAGLVRSPGVLGLEPMPLLKESNEGFGAGGGDFLAAPASHDVLFSAAADPPSFLDGDVVGFGRVRSALTGDPGPVFCGLSLRGSGVFEPLLMDVSSRNRDMRFMSSFLGEPGCDTSPPVL